MTTIEVPISLIKAGDMDAIRELLPKPNLFGRWATHPDYGRGIIVSPHPTKSKKIKFVYKDEEDTSSTCWDWIPLKVLTLDPVELATAEDFKNAPEGTIVEAPRGNAYQKVYNKVYNDCWESVSDELKTEELAASGPWKVLRWGWGE